MSVIYLRNVDEDLKAALKSEAALAKISIESYVVAVLKSRDASALTLPAETPKDKPKRGRKK
jgi:plasmid stability protein